MAEALDKLYMHKELITKSCHKIAELECNRPLWEAVAHAQECQEQEEEEEQCMVHAWAEQEHLKADFEWECAC